MPGDVLLLTAGLVVLLAGGEALVRGAAGIAQVLGVAPLVVGLTVVSFGTSAPELAVNLLAASQGDTGLSYGNVVGSNLANIGLILASAALLRPLEVRSVVLARELPMMLLATLVALVLASDRTLAGDAHPLWNRGDGLVMLLVFGVFIYYTINELLLERERRAREPLAVPAARADLGWPLEPALPPGAGVAAAREPEDLPGEVEAAVARARAEAAAQAEAERALLRRFALLVALGGVGLVVGARLTVDGALGLARALGVSEAIIGLTIVAIGTSLPELAASVIAALRRQADLAVGNVVGSNIFNLLLIGGACATVHPIQVPGGGIADLAMVLFLSVLLWVMGFTRKNRIIRAEGVTLLLVYAAYIGQRAYLAGG